MRHFFKSAQKSARGLCAIYLVMTNISKNNQIASSWQVHGVNAKDSKSASDTRQFKALEWKMELPFTKHPLKRFYRHNELVQGKRETGCQANLKEIWMRQSVAERLGDKSCPRNQEYIKLDCRCKDKSELGGMPWALTESSSSKGAQSLGHTESSNCYKVFTEVSCGILVSDSIWVSDLSLSEALESQMSSCIAEGNNIGHRPLGPSLPGAAMPDPVAAIVPPSLVAPTPPLNATRGYSENWK